MKKNLLVLTDAFVPPAYVPRVRTMCDVLVEHGWNVLVCTEEIRDVQANFVHSYPIISVPYYHCKGLWGKVEWGCKFLLNLFCDYKGYFFTQQYHRLLKNKPIDAVFCSSFNTFPLTVAARIAKQRRVPLHVDLRDMVEQCVGHQYNKHKRWAGKYLYECLNTIYQAQNLKRRNRVLRYANSLSSVSPWHVKWLKAFNDNVTLIYNGYDQHIFQPKDVRSTSFKIIYTGMIYGRQMQDPTLLLEALQRMVQQGRMPEELECHFYVKPETQTQLKIYAEECGLKAYIYCHDYVPPQDIPSLLHDASVVLVLSNTTSPSGPYGIMTTKFYEALGVEKPVLCVRSDEDQLARLIRETEAGIAAVHVDEVESFILEKYAEWKQYGFTRQRVNPIEKEKYCRQRQALQFITCLNNMQ